MQASSKEAERIVNALKSGVIPDTDLDLLCIGRDKEIKEMKRCLDFTSEGNGCVKFVCGDYGSGKSFMLSKVRQLAVRKNFAVSRIQINRSFNFSSLDIVYYNIMHNLASKVQDGSGTDFEGLFNTWIDKLKTSVSHQAASDEIRNVISSLNNFNSSFARAFLTYVKARIARDNELSNASASWIKGEKNIPATLKAKFDIKGDIDKYSAMDMLKAFIHLLGLIGYNGLVVLVDELELVMSVRSDIRKGSYENLRQVIDASGGGELNRCMFVFAGTNELFENEDNGIKTYPALQQRIGEISAKRGPSFTDMRQPIMKLDKLGLDDLLILTNRIVETHKEAYGWEPAISVDAVRNWTLLTLTKESGTASPGSAIKLVNTRIFITKLVEILDIMEQNKELNLYNTELRIVNKNGVDVFVNTFQRQ